MKQIGLVLLSLVLLFSITTVSFAEGNQRSGRGSGDMQLLNQGIAYLTGEGAEQNYEKALEIFQQAYETNNKKAARYLGMIYERFFGDHKPARSCVEVARLPKDGLVEIEAVAVKEV